MKQNAFFIVSKGLLTKGITQIFLKGDSLTLSHDKNVYRKLNKQLERNEEDGKR